MSDNDFRVMIPAALDNFRKQRVGSGEPVTGEDEKKD